MIKLVRCDDRMIHGQFAVRVISDFDIQYVVGVDDFTASNPVLKSIFTMAIPPSIKGEILSTEEAMGAIEPHIHSSQNVLVLIKSPEAAAKIFKANPDLKKELNIGPMSNRKNTTKVTRFAYLTPEEVTAVNEMEAMGVRVYFNQTIDQKMEEWADVRRQAGL